MGHYDDIMEERDSQELKRRAEQAGRSVKDQLFYENQFLPAAKIAREEIERQKAIKLYEQHKDRFE